MREEYTDEDFLEENSQNKGVTMLPNFKVKISADGDKQHLEGQQKTDNCSILSELAKRTGKVIEDKDKDHTPVHQSVHQKEA